MPELTYPTGKTCRCGEPAIVGYGNPPTWYCQADFENAMKEVRRTITAALAASR